MTNRLKMRALLWTAYIAVLAALVDGSFVISASNVRVVADSCNLWQKTGQWLDVDSPGNPVIARWKQRCESSSPSDVLINMANGSYVGRTDEKLASFWTEIRIRDRFDNIAAWLAEVLDLSIYTKYTIGPT